MPGFNFIQPLLRHKWTALMLSLLSGLSSLLFLAAPDFESKFSYFSHETRGAAFARDAFSRAVVCNGLRHRLSFDPVSNVVQDHILRMAVVASTEGEAVACIDNVSKLFQKNEAIYLKKRRSFLEEKNIKLKREQEILRKEIGVLASDRIVNAAHLIIQYSSLQGQIDINTDEIERLQPSTIYAPVSTTIVKKRNKLRYALGGGLAGLLLFIFLLSVIDTGSVVGNRPD